MNPSTLLTYLICPQCQKPELFFKKNGYHCRGCKSFYPIIEGVPVLLDTSRLSEQEAGQKKWFEKHYSKFSGEKYCLEKWRMSMLERLFNNVKCKKITTYLDIGCGATGYTVIEGVKKNNWTAIGADISLQAMIRAKRLADKQKTGDRTGFIVCSAENLPFKKESFDLVSAISLLEHLEEDDKTMHNIAQVTKKGGFLFVCVPNTYERMWLFLRPVYFYFDKKIGHKRHYSVENLDLMMKASSFKLQKHFYNAHLKKLFFLVLEKFGLVSEARWWEVEKSDFNSDFSGLQLNAVYRKII